MTVYINDKGLISITGITAKQFCQLDSAVAFHSDCLDDGPANASCTFGGMENDPPFDYLLKMKVTNGDIKTFAAEFSDAYEHHLVVKQTIAELPATTTPI